MALSVHIKKKLKDFELAVDFDMEEGIVGFLGSSGCGKSMTLKCIAGIETPDEGSIVLDGEVLFDKKAGIDLSPQKRKVGYLFQNYALFPHMTVRQNIEAGLEASGKSKQEKKDIKPEEINDAKVAIENFLNSFLKQISNNIEYIVKCEESVLYVNIKGEESVRLIGYRGEALNSLQVLLTTIASKNSDGNIKVIRVNFYVKGSKRCLYMPKYFI